MNSPTSQQLDQQQDAAVPTPSDVPINSVLEMKISCIEEERLGLGIGDLAEIFITPDPTGVTSFNSPYGPFKVLKVESSKTVVLSVDIDGGSDELFKVMSAIKQGRGTVKKVSNKMFKWSELDEFFPPNFPSIFSQSPFV